MLAATKGIIAIANLQISQTSLVDSFFWLALRVSVMSLPYLKELGAVPITTL